MHLWSHTAVEWDVAGAQVLIDPVCFLTCYPQLLYNFVYKVPMLKETLSSVTGLLSAARFLFSRDLIIAEVCSIPRVFQGYHHSCARLAPSCLGLSYESRVAGPVSNYCSD